MNIPRYKYFYAIIDFVLLSFVFLLVQNTSIYLGLSFYNDYWAATKDHIVFFELAAFLILFIFQYNNLYKHHILVARNNHIILILKSLLHATVFLIVVAFVYKLPYIHNSRLFIAFFIFYSVTSFILLRVFVLNSFYLSKRKNIIFSRRVLIVGGGKAGQILATKFLLDLRSSFSIVGFIDDNLPIGEEIISKIKVLGNVSSIQNITKAKKIDEIILAIDNINYDRLIEIVEICKKTSVSTKISSELFQIVSQKIEVESYNDFPIINATSTIDLNLNLLLKRVADFVLALAGLILLSPLFLTLGILIKASSKGPVFYKQTRIGFKGVPFKFYKFRSMVIDNEDDLERREMMVEFIKRGKTQEISSTKIVNKARVTWIGKIIRKYSLDEFPQLMNVLLGDMSIVGPRPCLPYEFEHFEEWQKKRHDVYPGCTGVWQVFGRGDVSFKDSVILDLYYVNNMSPWLDVQIILKTIPVVVLGKGGK